MDKLQKEAAVMSEADRLRAEREARDLELNVNRRFNELQEDLNLRRNEEVGRMQRALLQEVQAYARANGYQLIVSEGVLFAAEGVDITPQLIAAIKAKAPAAPKAAAPKAAKAAGSTKPNALQQPLKPSAELGAIVGTSPLPRGEVVSKVWDYIKKHNLQNPENKREIVADDKLKKVFGKDRVSMFEMNKHISKHVKA